MRRRDLRLGAFCVLIGVAYLGMVQAVTYAPSARRFAEAVMIPGLALVTLGIGLIVNSFRAPRRPSAT